MGCHAFRRFRVTELRKHLVPEDLIAFWLGHGGKTVTDVYSRLRDDAGFRKQVVANTVLSFELPSDSAVIAMNGPKIAVGTIEELAVNY